MFQTYEVAKQLVVRLREVIPVIKQVDRDLADQMHRAATNVLLNLAEGQKFENGNRLRHYKIAQGSAHEVKAAFDAAEAWGWLADAAEERALLDRLLALLWKLTHAPSLQPKPALARRSLTS